MQEKSSDSFAKFFLAQLITPFAVYRVCDNAVFLTRQYCLRHFSYNYLLIKLDKLHVLFHILKMNLVALCETLQKEDLLTQIIM